jgi:uncharacterized protein (DUF2336 family)
MQLERTLSASSQSRRAEIAEQLAGLVLAHKSLSDDQVELIRRILERLIDRIETRTLVDLAEKLATAERAPREIMRSLAAHDEFLVAGPVLAQYRDLDDAHLAAISQTRSQAHLLAISERDGIGEQVTDVLALRGDAAVARNLAQNAGARLSAYGFETLSKRAASDDILAESTALRADVPAHIFGQILVRASQAVQRRMIAAARPDMHDEIKSVLDRVAGELADELPARQRHDAVARALLQRYPTGQIPEGDLLRFALGGQTDEVVVALSFASALTTARVARVLDDVRFEMVVLLCRALGHAWPTARALLTLRPNRRMTADAWSSAYDGFSRLSPVDAQQLVDFWRRQDASS